MNAFAASCIPWQIVRLQNYRIHRAPYCWCSVNNNGLTVQEFLFISLPPHSPFVTLLVLPGWAQFCHCIQLHTALDLRKDFRIWPNTKYLTQNITQVHRNWTLKSCTPILGKQNQNMTHLNTSVRYMTRIPSPPLWPALDCEFTCLADWGSQLNWVRLMVWNTNRGRGEIREMNGCSLLSVLLHASRG